MWLTDFRASCIKSDMRTHTTIIQDAKVARIRAILGERGFVVADPTVRSWTRRPDDDGNIPSPYWNALAEAGVTTLEELAAHAEARARASEAA